MKRPASPAPLRPSTSRRARSRFRPAPRSARARGRRHADHGLQHDGRQPAARRDPTPSPAGPHAWAQPTRQPSRRRPSTSPAATSWWVCSRASTPKTTIYEDVIVGNWPRAQAANFTTHFAQYVHDLGRARRDAVPDDDGRRRSRHDPRTPTNDRGPRLTFIGFGSGLRCSTGRARSLGQTPNEQAAGTGIDAPAGVAAHATDSERRGDAGGRAVRAQRQDAACGARPVRRSDTTRSSSTWEGRADPDSRQHPGRAVGARLGRQLAGERAARARRGCRSRAPARS